ncbi:MAG: hypothetical protein M3Q27_05355, partial [Actinomycetota bacterium]|nr:hypothetical protein [Actinomycetota bacterium]
VAALAAGLALASARALPPLPAAARHDHDKGAVAVVLRSPVLVLLLGLTLTLVVAQFNVWTYIEPFLREEIGMSGGGVSRTLAVFGAAAVVGSLIGGRAADASLRVALLVGIPMLITALVAVQASTAVHRLLQPAVALQAAAFAVLAVSTQLAVLKCSPAGAATETASALQGVVFQVGITAGSAVASGFVELGMLRSLPTVSVAVGVVALALVLVFPRLLCPAPATQP